MIQIQNWLIDNCLKILMASILICTIIDTYQRQPLASICGGTILILLFAGLLWTENE